MALFLSIFPIGLLIYLMTKKNAMASSIALPLIAVLVLVIQALYFGRNLGLLSASVLSGLIATLTPITVIFGAILFNKMMEATGQTDVLRTWLGNLSPHPVAQLMIIGWAFAFMIEGASGFGTPAAIAAPILMGLGYNPLKVAIFTLIMNSVPVSFGAVGTPTWFGFGALGLNDVEILDIGKQSVIIHLFASLIVPPLGLAMVLDFKTIKKSLAFLYISVFSCVIPYAFLAQFNYEFPALVGGAIGLFVSVIAASLGIGLSKDCKKQTSGHTVSKKQVLKALSPIGMLIGILIITRIQQLGIKDLLINENPLFNLNLGIFDLEVSKALILTFANILGQDVTTSYKTLYVPALIPFVIAVIASFILFKTQSITKRHVWRDTFASIKSPLFALLGAMVMVELMLVGADVATDGTLSPVKIIGQAFAQGAGDKWVYFASYLGAVGAFFSGSATVSNLTFGAIQAQIAEETGLSKTLVLALQSVGGAMGNMVCINNIIAVCSVLGVVNSEGAIIKKTAIPMFVYGVIAAACAVVIIPMVM